MAPREAKRADAMRPTTSLLLLLALIPCPAATWIGGGDPMVWTDTANWSGGAMPVAGETIVFRPTVYTDVIRLGGGEATTPIDVVLDTTRPLILELAAGTAIGSLSTITGGYHSVTGAALVGASTWNLATGSAVRLGALAAWSQLELASGGGVLLIGPQDGEGVVPATIVARSGVVQFDDEAGPSHAGVEMVLAGGQMTFTWDLGRLGSLRIEEEHGFTEGWGAAQVGHLTVAGGGDRDLSLMPTLRSPETTLRVGGNVKLGANLETDLVLAEVGELDLGGGERGFSLRLEAGRVTNGALAGDVRVVSGTLACATTDDVEVLAGTLGGEGLTVAGTLRVEEALVVGDLSVGGTLQLGGVGTTDWQASLMLGDGARVTWVPRATEGTVVHLGGSWTLTGTSILEVGETDWTAPYWDANREVRLVDTWDSSTISGTFMLEGADKGEEGFWTLGQADDGDVLLAWTALGAAPVPEASAVAPVLGALALALSARRRRARPR